MVLEKEGTKKRFLLGGTYFIAIMKDSTYKPMYKVLVLYDFVQGDVGGSGYRQVECIDGRLSID